MPGAQRVEFLAGNKAARVQAALGALLDDVVDIMLGECEQVYPAIYQVVSGALNAGDAATAVMMITEGEA